MTAEEAAPATPAVSVADRPRPIGVGMPALLLLHEFGRLVHQAFGIYPHLVGSALTTRTPRDIDVRLMIPVLADYRALVGLPHECGLLGTKWAALSLAFSLAGKALTGLPIDFQIQNSPRYMAYEGCPMLLLGEYGALA